MSLVIILPLWLSEQKHFIWLLQTVTWKLVGHTPLAAIAHSLHSNQTSCSNSNVAKLPASNKPQLTKYFFFHSWTVEFDSQN